MHMPYKAKCPCGSKKRYIDCCLIKPDSWNEIMNRQKIATSLRWKIIDFATSTLSDETEKALDVYFQNSYTKPTDIPDEKMGPFLDWYIHDYKLLKTHLTVLEHFFEKRSELYDVERFLTSGWLASYNNCYQAIEVKPGFWILLEEIVTKQKYLVANPELSEMTPPWSIFVGRLVPLGEIFEFDFIHHTLPPTSLAPLQQSLISSYEKNTSDKEQVTFSSFVKDFLSANLPRFVSEVMQLIDFSPKEALTEDLLPYLDLFEWICTSFYGSQPDKKPASLTKLLLNLKDKDILNSLYEDWPNGIKADNFTLATYLTWLEFLDACLVIHYGKKPAFDFSSKFSSIGQRKTSPVVFKPLSETRTKINQESQALEKISKVLHEFMLDRYSATQIQAAILLWQHYLGQASEVPEIRNPKTWAGAVEYCLTKLLAIPTTQKSLAQTYNVSAPSLSRIYNIISKQIDLNSLDKDAFLS
ncbi:MAG: hypothetical protein PHD88_05205 [Firmicutes bacterium]|nr:hypothetical protein [Bacillota bacterium]MDD4263317.1 hypothetical protein [Bacillota bacterium]MDD4693782.1 hypothetical protein [Bacillota bacterium]